MSNITSKQFDDASLESVTIEDVAKRAGVSISTVSRALNDVGKASWPSAQRRIARIKKIAQQMNYQPNMLGQALRQGKSMAIGLIAKGLSAPMAAAHISKFIHAAQEKSYLTYAVNIDQYGDDSAQVARIARDLLSRKVDGLVIYRNLAVDRKTCQFLESLNVPVVFIGDWGPQDSQHRIDLDFEAGIKQVAEHLSQLKHKRAAFIPSHGLADSPQHKWIPYERCFKQVDIDLNADEIWQIDSASKHIGRDTGQVARALLEVDPNVTALLLNNDTAAAGVISAVQNMGLKVPEDISVVGFDDMEFTRFFNPSITSVSGPEPEKIGQAAFNMLSALMDDSQAKIEKQTFPFELVVRESTGPANHCKAASGGTGVPPVIFAQQEKSVGRINVTHPPQQKVDIFEAWRDETSDNKVDAFANSFIHPTNNLSNSSATLAPEPQTASPKRPLQFTLANAPKGDSS